jgi:hypothetical protein
MKQVLISLTAILLFAGFQTSAQQTSKSKLTFVFPNNETRLFSNTSDKPFTIDFAIKGLETQQEADAFVSLFEKQEGVINLSLARDKVNGQRLASGTFYNLANFNYFKSLMEETGVEKVIVEEMETNVSDMKEYNGEQILKIQEFNLRIKNYQVKIDYINNNPEQKKKAEEIGWFTEAYGYLAKTKEEKKQYLESIQ